MPSIKTPETKTPIPSLPTHSPGCSAPSWTGRTGTRCSSRTPSPSPCSAPSTGGTTSFQVGIQYSDSRILWWLGLFYKFLNATVLSYNYWSITTVETAYKVTICPTGNLIYMQIYLITDIKLLWKGVFGLYFIYFIIYKWFYSITGYFISGFYWTVKCSDIVTNCLLHSPTVSQYVSDYHCSY